MLAYDYPILGFFWTFLYFFVFVIWIMLLFRIFVDIFQSHDMGGFAKAVWFIFVDRPAVPRRVRVSDRPRAAR